MSPTSPKTSSRLRRAATAERAELDRHRARLFDHRKRLRAELDQIEQSLMEVDERVALLNRIAPLEDLSAEAVDDKNESEAVGATPIVKLPATEILRGTAIRETAVRLLAQSQAAAQPIHYKRLYELLTEAGFSVAGKDPLATFLTQLSRSPVMRKATQAGIYELDRDSQARLRSELSLLQAELRAVTGNPAPTDDLAEIRQRRESVLSEITQVERAIEEAARVLGDGRDDRNSVRGAA